MTIIANGVGLRNARDQYAVAVISAISALEDISQRHRRHGDVTVRPTEALTLRGAAGKLDESLGRIPVHIWREGCKDVKVVTAKIDQAREMARREVVQALQLEDAPA
jgi:hypothetical protein